MLAITDKGQLFVLGKQEDTAEDLAPASGAGSASKAAAQAAALQHSSGFELQHTIDVDLMESKEDSSPTTVKCITAYGKGFAIGGSNGFFCVFEKTDNKKEPFIHIKSFKRAFCPAAFWSLYLCVSRLCVCCSAMRRRRQWWRW